MTYKEETFVLNTLKELKEFIRSPAYKQLCREIHKNNIMLKKLLAIEYARLRNHNKENEEDFGRNVLANALSETILKTLNMANKTNNRPKSNPPKTGATLKRRPYDKGGKVK